MAKFTEKEEFIIRKIVATTEFKDTFLATLIDENTDAIVLEWDELYTEFKFIYRQLANEADNHQFIIFDKIKEIIVLLKNLEDEKFIYVFENKDITKGNRLFNSTKYEREDDGTYHLKERILETNGQTFQATGYILSKKIEIPCDFGKLVQHFGNGIFHVSGSLRELVTNDFQTPEQKRHHQVLFWTRIAFIVAFITSVIAASDVIIRWCKPKDNSLQNELMEIKQTIEQKTLPEVFKTEIINDTLTTKVIHMPQVKPTNQLK